MSDEVVLRPDRLRAGLWSLVGIASLWLAAWATVVGDLDRRVGLALVVSGTLLTLMVAVQVVAPALWTLHVGPHGVRGRVLGFHVDVAWTDCRAVEVGRRLGEPRLVLRRDRRLVLVLPIGADVAGLRTVVDRIDLSAATS